MRIDIRNTSGPRSEASGCAGASDPEALPRMLIIAWGDTRSMKQIDLGGVSFAEIREKDKHYVDKTLLIKDILGTDDRGAYLFTRPRRFGKSMNLSMLDAFLNMRYKGNTWFDGLAISDHPEFESYKNAFSVIHLDLGVADADDFDEFLGGMRKAVAKAFRPHRYLLEWADLSNTMRSLFEIFDSETMPLSRDMLKYSVNRLFFALAQYHGRPPVILIDEYDRAVSNAFGEESHKEMMSFLAKFMYASVKGNPYREMVYVTGMTRIAKQSISYEMNNFVVNDVFSERSDERFGFTESEVKNILEDYGYGDRFDVAKTWYGGFRFGDAEVYNPYSIMCFVDQGCEPKTYRTDEDRNALIRTTLKSITSKKYAEIMKMVDGGSVMSDLIEAFPYEAIEMPGQPLYSLMVMSGYLGAVPTNETDIFGDSLFRLSVPNEEVRELVGRLMDDSHPADV